MLEVVVVSEGEVEEAGGRELQHEGLQEGDGALTVVLRHVLRVPGHVADLVESYISKSKIFLIRKL